MPRDYKLYLDDIIASIDKILKYTDKMDFDSFRENDITIDAVVRNLEIIGEAAKNLPDSVVKKSQNIDWKKIKGLRDILAHQYFGVNSQIIWDIVENKIVELKIACTDLL